MRLVSIDPGKHLIGWAVWDDSVLTACGLLRFEKLSDVLQYVKSLSPAQIICEVPQVYRMSRSKGDPNDLIDLALTAGVCLACAGRSMAVRPRAWKGTIDPDVLDARVRRRMGDHWPFVAGLKDVPKSLQHNTVDAVGLGLWCIDRGGVR
jgi:hypothetical protein